MTPNGLAGTMWLGPFGSSGSSAARPPVATAPWAVHWVRDLIPGWADTTVVCPRCPVDGDVATVLDHLLGEHGSEFACAADWLETVDGDMFALAVHFLMSGAHTAATSNTRRS